MAGIVGGIDPLVMEGGIEHGEEILLCSPGEILLLPDDEERLLRTGQGDIEETDMLADFAGLAAFRLQIDALQEGVARLSVAIRM